MTRIPEAGRVKPQLIPPPGPEGAAALHAAFQRTLRRRNHWKIAGHQHDRSQALSSGSSQRPFGWRASRTMHIDGHHNLVNVPVRSASSRRYRNRDDMRAMDPSQPRRSIHRDPSPWVAPTATLCRRYRGWDLRFVVIGAKLVILINACVSISPFFIEAIATTARHPSRFFGFCPKTYSGLTNQTFCLLIESCRL